MYYLHTKEVNISDSVYSNDGTGDDNDDYDDDDDARTAAVQVNAYVSSECQNTSTGCAKPKYVE